MTEVEGQGVENSAAPNRYLLIAALATVALLTIYIVQTNLEPPKVGEVAATQAANSRIAEPVDSIDAAAMHVELMEQVAHIRAMLQRDSLNVDAWVALANLFYDANMPPEAIAHYRRALELKPGDLDLVTDLATMLRADGQIDSAMSLLNQVVTADSTRTQAWFNLGVLQSADLQDHRAALVSWKKFLALAPPSDYTDAVQREIARIEKELSTSP